MIEPLPLTADDLRKIADATEAVDNTSTLQSHEVLGRFEIYRPDGDDQIGWVQRFEGDMGWGFVFRKEDQ